MSDIAAIAAGLTKAQRKAFARSTEIGCVASAQTCAALEARGLATIPMSPLIKTQTDWTPLGLAVRAHLAQKDTQNG